MHARRATPHHATPDRARTGPPGRDAAIRLARRQFRAGTRVEMQALATEPGVSRMTLNRWVGSRDRLLGEVNWPLAEPTLDRCRDRTGDGGGRHGRHAGGVHRRRARRAVHADVPAPGRRDRAADPHPAQQRPAASGTWPGCCAELPDPPGVLPIDDLAYLVVRIAESFCYVDLITDGEPDASKVGAAIRRLPA